LTFLVGLGWLVAFLRFGGTQELLGLFFVIAGAIFVTFHNVEGEKNLPIHRRFGYKGSLRAMQLTYLYVGLFLCLVGGLVILVEST
jgi:hypothetical protein